MATGGKYKIQDDDDDDDCDDDDYDLYIIGAVCLSVTKVIISVFKGFGRFTRLGVIHKLRNRG